MAFKTNSESTNLFTLDLKDLHLSGGSQQNKSYPIQVCAGGVVGCVCVNTSTKIKEFQLRTIETGTKKI